MVKHLKKSRKYCKNCAKFVDKIKDKYYMKMYYYKKELDKLRENLDKEYVPKEKVAHTISQLDNFVKNYMIEKQKVREALDKFLPENIVGFGFKNRALKKELEL